MIHISREGLNYYFVEITGSNRCRYVIQAHGEEAEALQKETKSQNKKEEMELYSCERREITPRHAGRYV